MIIQPLYKNPFLNIDANEFSSKDVIRYWASPLECLNIAESSFCYDRTPMFIEGARGTGKTMLLKYYSYDVQQIQNQHEQNKYVGIYLRLNDLKYLSSNNKRINADISKKLFINYLELSVLYKIVLTFALMKDNGLISPDSESAFCKIMSQTLSKSRGTLFEKNFTDLLNVIKNQIFELDKFRSEIIFNDITPSFILFDIGELCFSAIEQIITLNISLSNYTFILMIDEYENFNESQQIVVNTLVKKSGTYNNGGTITCRIGYRPNGIYSYQTEVNAEFLQFGKDFTKLEISNIKNKKSFKEFLLAIAKNRLQDAGCFHSDNIRKFLMFSEDYVWEAKYIVKDDKRHFDLIPNYTTNSYDGDLISAISYPENPLIEMLAILWLRRNNNVMDTITEMKSYLKKHNRNRFSENYINKYKLSLLFVLASIYKSEKLYYSYDTIVRLSSGIVRNFMLICNKCFDIANYQNQDNLLNKNNISPNIQNAAIRMISRGELYDISSIPVFGKEILNFVININNIFSYYHTDKDIKYPETNQFAFKSEIINEEHKKIVSTALKWGIIQERQEFQKKSLDQPMGKIYLVNRIYSPLFDISIRIRGGFNFLVENDIMGQLFNNPLSLTEIRHIVDKKQYYENINQISLFDIPGENL